MSARVASVNVGPRHRFSKTPVQCISLLAGLGVAGDAHCGEYVKHRSRARWTPRAPNLRQVHLIHRELFDELKTAGYAITPGDMGENVTTEGIDLLALPTGTRLNLGASAVVEVSGLRNPCVQMDRFAHGLMQAVLEKSDDGLLIRKSGVMGIVITGGGVRAGDAIHVELPQGEQHALKPV